MAIRSVPARVLTRVDLPAPELPSSTAVSRGFKTSLSAAMPSPRRADRAMMRVSATTARAWAIAPGTSAQRSVLVSTTTGRAPLWWVAAK